MAKSQQDYRHKDGQAIQGEGLEKASSTAAAVWSLMETALKDGRPIWLKRGEEGHAEECYWRTSRKFHGGSWVPTAYWSRVVGPPAPLDFEPLGWYRQNNAL